MQPIIDDVTPNSGIAGDVITINGWYFTNKKPKVYLEDPNTHKKKSCKVISSSMDPLTGSSTLQFVIPKWGLDNYNLILINLIGQATVSFPYTLSDDSISLPKTGQTTSYAPGDDGDLEKGVTWPDPRFIASSDCVTDNLTGLMWAKNANLPSGTKTWQQALDYVNSGVRWK
jgi:hypothetical protein